MHDGLEIEGRGKPAAVVCTDKFVITARARAEVLGLPDYPFAIIPHPLGRLSEEDLRERVENALPQVVNLLLHGRAD